MKQNTHYIYELEEKGFVRAKWGEMSECCRNKSDYVEL